MTKEEFLDVGAVKVELRDAKHEGLYGVGVYFEAGVYKGTFFVGANAAQQMGEDLVAKGKQAQEKNLQSTKIN